MSAAMPPEAPAAGPAPGGAPAVAVEGLDVVLGRARILEGVSAVFPAAAMTALIGPNGAGKSTLVRALLGIVPAAAGVIEIAGKRLEQYGRRELARAVGFVPQETHMEFSFRVEDVVMMGRYPHLRPLERERPADREAVARAMEELDLRPLARRDVTTLSAGERQRVFLARALATGARILIGDEPVSSLDIGHRLETLELLRGLARRGFAIVVVLHDLDLALRFADRVVLLDRGRVAASGAPLPILTGPELERAFGVRAETLGEGRSLYFRRDGRP